MVSSDTGCGPVVIESDEDNSSQKELDSENDFKCCSLINRKQPIYQDYIIKAFILTVRP